MTAASQKGFSIVEALLILVIVGILGFTGWFVYHARQATDKDLASNSSAVPTYKKKTNAKTTVTSDQYAGWSSYTTKYDKLSFKYPSSWKLSDTSNTDSTDITPGQDSVSVTSSSGLQVFMGSGVTTFDGGNPSIKLVSAMPIAMLGGAHYLVFSSTGTDLVTTTKALASSSNLPLSKNVHLSSTAVSGMEQPLNLIGLQYDQETGLPLSKFEQDPNYKTALLILESMKY